MMDTSHKLAAILELVEYGDYFTIHRPRQFGKTTMLLELTAALEARVEYLPLLLNFQGVDRSYLASDAAFGQMFWRASVKAVRRIDPELGARLEALVMPRTLDEVSDRLSEMVEMAAKRVVLLIDEVDAHSNYDPFLSFLAMLRSKYLVRSIGEATFHSVVLAGVHDIKNLKYKLRDPDEARYNSPWNIAVDFEVRLSFDPTEIAPMLEEYSAAEGVPMNVAAIAERLYYFTSGYPFLVSKLCKIIAERLLPAQPVATGWTLAHVEESVQHLLLENNTNFDDLIKNLQNHQDLYDLVYHIVVDGGTVTFNPHNATIAKGVLYGLFKRNGRIKVHNRIYEQVVYNYMISNVEVGLRTENYNTDAQFGLVDGGLDVEQVLNRFQAFLREEYSDQDQAFLERQWRLIFLAFLRPILNGHGYTFKEVQISEEKRLDVTITYYEHRYVVELKRWYGDAAHQRGLAQLADYLERQQQTVGYLLSFEYKTAKTWRSERITHAGKTIYAVWV